MSDGVWDLNLRTGALYWNDRLFEMLGLSRSEFTPTFEAFVELVHPEYRQKILDSYDRRLKGGVQKHDIALSADLRLRHSTGKEE